MEHTSLICLASKRKYISEYWPYYIIFIFFLYVGWTIPLAGDDWETSNWYSHNSLITFFGMIRAWSYYTGRISSNFINSFFAHYSDLWIIYYAFIQTYTIYILAKWLAFSRNIFSVAVMFVMVLSLSIGLRREIQFNLVVHTAYATALPMYLTYLHWLNNENTSKRLKIWNSNKCNLLFIFMWTSLSSNFIETISLGFLGLNIALAFYKLIKNKYLSSFFLVGIAGNLFGIIVNISSIGFRSRFSENLGTVPMIDKLLNNLPILINMLFFDNILFFTILLSVCFIYLMLFDLSYLNRIIRIMLYLSNSFLLFILISKIILQALSDSYFISHSNIYNIFNSLFFASSAPFFYVVPSIMVLLVLVLCSISVTKIKLFLLLVMSICSTLPVLLSPNNRTLIISMYVFIAFTGYIAASLKFNNIDFKKTFYALIILLLLLRVETYVNILENAKKITLTRNTLVEEYKIVQKLGLIDKNYKLTIPAYDNNFLQSANPGLTDFHYIPMIRYYGLNKDTKVLIDNSDTTQ